MFELVVVVSRFFAPGAWEAHELVRFGGANTDACLLAHLSAVGLLVVAMYDTLFSFERFILTNTTPSM